MSNVKKYLTTSEACERLGTYAAYLWSLVGRGLSPPVRLSPKQTYWLADEVEAIADEQMSKRKLIESFQNRRDDTKQ